MAEFIGNLAADQCAGEIAAEAQLTQEERKRIKEARAMARQVQRRIAASLRQHFQERSAGEEKKARQPRSKEETAHRTPAEQRRRETTEHTLTKLPCGSLRCSKCGQHCAARAAKKWLESSEGQKCAGTRATLQDHTRVEANRESRMPKIGSSFAHASHAMSLTAGTWWCQIC